MLIHLFIPLSLSLSLLAKLRDKKRLPRGSGDLDPYLPYLLARRYIHVGYLTVNDGSNVQGKIG